jgi:HEAT repeat protein
MGEAALPAVPTLVECMTDEDGDVRDAARLTLGQIGRPAVPILLKLLDNEDPLIRGQAQQALDEIRGFGLDE